MIVADTSVVLAALTGHESSRRALTDERIIAPHLIDVEIAHALRALVRGRKLTADEALTVLDVWQRMAVDRLPSHPQLHRTWELRDNLTAHDAAFVALAETHRVPLVTRDRRLAGASGLRCTIQFVGA